MTILAMRNTIFRKMKNLKVMRGGAINSSIAHRALLLLLFCGTLSISGCIGLANLPGSANQAKSPSGISLSVSPGSVNFGSVAVGGTVSQSVTISNTSASSISITQESTVANGFTIGGASLPVTIGAGQQSTLNVVFSPKSQGAISGNVSVMSSASSIPSTVTVSGTGVAPQALLNTSAAKLNFGSVNSGDASVQDVTLVNAGNSNVTISGINVSGGRFTAIGVSPGLILTPGQNAVLVVTFSAPLSGALNGSITVLSNAANSPAVISLSGVGVRSVSHAVAMAWTPDAPAAASYTYNVYRSTLSGGPYTKMNPAGGTAAAFTDTSARGGQMYYYVVTAVDSNGIESPVSEEATAVIPPP